MAFKTREEIEAANAVEASRPKGKCGFKYCENTEEMILDIEFPEKIHKVPLCEYHIMSSYRWRPEDVIKFLKEGQLVVLKDLNVTIS